MLRDNSGQGLLTSKTNHVIRGSAGPLGREDKLESEFNHVANESMNRDIVMNP